MSHVLRIVHLIAVCVFVGSIPAHIVLGAAIDPAADPAAFAAFHQAKLLLTVSLTGAGIAAAVASGVLLALARRQLFRRGWLWAKIGLVTVVALNGGVVLTPLAAEMAALAAGPGPLAAEFADLAAREAVAGSVNQVLLLAVVALAVIKPKRARPLVERA